MCNGNYYTIIAYILRLYWDNGKENGNYYSILGNIRGILGLFTIPFGTRTVRRFNAFCQILPRVAEECMM